MTGVDTAVTADGAGLLARGSDPLARRGPTTVAAAGDPDRVEFRTVGIDVGSATFHFGISVVCLERRARELSSRFDIVSREVLWSSPVALTPYLGGGDAIDVTAVDEAVRGGYLEAGITAGDIDSGAVLLTGTALARRNARALADRLAGDSGRFVCAAAGHHLEATLAAHGSGVIEQSLVEGMPVVNVDIGGGTTKLALAVDGEVQATAALAVGSRLLAWDAAGALTRIEASVVPVARSLGITLRPGTEVPAPAVNELCDRLALAVARQLHVRPGDDLLLTDPFLVPSGPFAIVLSGGVAEYLHHPEDEVDHGDLGPTLARAVVARLGADGLADRLRPARQRIRATVIGASQFSTQVSGSTIRIGDDSVLPVHNLPVMRPRLALVDSPGPVAIAAAVHRAIDERFDDRRDTRAVAVAVRWEGPPEYRRLRALADGIHDAIRRLAPPPELLVVIVDRDLAATLGRLLVDEVGVDAPSLICLDNIDTGALDYVDIGRPGRPANVVPVVIKSLLFDAGTHHRFPVGTPPRARGACP